MIQFGLAQFESFKIEPLKFLKLESNRSKKFKPLKPRFHGSVLVFNLGQNSNINFSKFKIIYYFKF